MLDIKVLSIEVHATAVEKGWWPAPRSWHEIRLLIVSEIAEALEAFRESRMALVDPAKPEGFTVELADVVIRCADWIGAALSGLTQDEFNAEEEIRNAQAGCNLAESTIPGCLDRLLVLLYCGGTVNVGEVIAGCYELTKRLNLDLDAAIRVKTVYNKQRAFRHGGKAL